MIWHPSPNYGPRRDDLRPDIVVIHYTAMSSAERALKVLTSEASEVSSHYLIAEDGRVFHLVEEAMRAWHAGAGSWGGSEDVNSRSIGIELANDGVSPFAAPLMDSLEQLLREILTRWDIPAQRVIGHSDMAPGRKIDPGARFDWRRLARQDLAIWPDAVAEAAVDRARFCADLAAFGYGVEGPFDALLAAFRSRFAPSQQGLELGPLDMARAAGLASLALIA